MKTKILLTAAFCLVTLLGVNAQFEKGNHVANLGIGLGNALYTGGGYTSSIPPISLSYEVGVKDGIFDKGILGIGGYVGYTSAKWETSYFGGTYGWKYTNIIIGVRGALHYPLVEKLDTYAGLMLGYDIVSAKETGDLQTGYNFGSATASHIILPGFVGARYFFSEKVGAFAELGWGVAYLNLGLTLKIK